MNQDRHWEHTYLEWQQPELMKILEEVFQHKITTVFDIGANVGAWTRLVRERFGEKDYYCFEPDPKNCEFLKNHLPDVTLIDKGIFYGITESHAYSWGNDNCGGYFVEGASSLQKDPVTIKRETIFQLVELESLNLPKPDVIKIDIEGGERNVISNSTILQNTEWLIVEWHYTDNIYSNEAHEFFIKHLPKHKIVINRDGDNMFVLHYEN